MWTVFFVALGALLGLSSADSPAFCRGKICPEFQENSTTLGYVIRKYKPSVWLEIRKAPNESKRFIMEKLKAYLKANGRTMETTVPIVGHVGLRGNQALSIRVFLGECTPSFQPAAPTDSRLHIHHDPEMTYYVTKLNPVPDVSHYWRNVNVWKTQALALISKLPSQGYNSFCAAHYGPRDSPNPYSEIWVHTSPNHHRRHRHHGHGSNSRRHNSHIDH